MNWLRVAALLTWSEVLRLSRTEQVFRYLLVPALIGIPAVTTMVVLLSSFAQYEGTVAIPAGEFGGLSVQSALEAERLRVIVAPDPMALWERGEVDAAIVSVKAGEGIYARHDPELATREAWLIDLVSDDGDVSERVSSAMSEAAEAELDAIVSLSGGVPAEVRVATARMVYFDGESALAFHRVRALRAYALMSMGGIALYFLTLTMVADRREGVTETMRALPIPITALLWSRVLASTGLQLLGSGLVCANLFLVLPMLGGRFTIPPFWVEVPGYAAALLAANSLLVATGATAPSPKTASNNAALAMFAQSGLLLWGAFGEPFALVPIAGAVAADGAVGRALAVVGCLTFSVLTLALCGKLLHTRVSLVLPRGTE